MVVVKRLDDVVSGARATKVQDKGKVGYIGDSIDPDAEIDQ